jgi:hypothetical protein
MTCSITELLGIGSTGGSVELTRTVATGNALVAGQGVSINASGEFVLYDGTRRLIGVATANAAAGSSATIFTLGKYSGTTITFGSAAELDGTGIDINFSTAAIDTGNLTAAALNASGIQFSPDGLKVIYFSTNAFESKRLTTAFNLTTAGTAVSFATTGQDTTMLNGCISDDGKFMFSVGTVNNRIYQYKLHTPYEANTAEFLYSYSLVDAFGWKNITVSDDLQYVMVRGSGSTILRSYKMLTPGDIRTCTLDSTVTLTSTQIEDIKINSTGTKLYVVDAFGTNSTDEHLITTPYNLATLNTTPAVTTVLNALQDGMGISSSGTRLAAFFSGNIQMYNTSAATSTLTIPIGEYVYLDSAGKPTPVITETLLGLRISSTEVILVDEV